jgi:hypothetical protein
MRRATRPPASWFPARKPRDRLGSECRGPRACARAANHTPARHRPRRLLAAENTHGSSNGLARCKHSISTFFTAGLLREPRPAGETRRGSSRLSHILGSLRADVETQASAWRRTLRPNGGSLRIASVEAWRLSATDRGPKTGMVESASCSQGSMMPFRRMMFP